MSPSILWNLVGKEFDDLWLVVPIDNTKLMKHDFTSLVRWMT